MLLKTRKQLVATNTSGTTPEEFMALRVLQLVEIRQRFLVERVLLSTFQPCFLRSVPDGSLRYLAREHAEQVKRPRRRRAAREGREKATDLQASGAAPRRRPASGRSSRGSMPTGKTRGASSASGCAAAAHTGRPLQRCKGQRSPRVESGRRTDSASSPFAFQYWEAANPDLLQ